MLSTYESIVLVCALACFGGPVVVGLLPKGAHQDAKHLRKVNRS